MLYNLERTNVPVDLIDKQTKEIRQDDDKTVYKSLDELAEDLPDHSPRFILLSYPLTLVSPASPLFTRCPCPTCLRGQTNRVLKPSGRMSVPYVMIYYMPTTCNSEQRMLYAGAKELMRNTSEVTKIFDIESPEDLEEIPSKLGAA